MFIPDLDFYPSRILKQQQKRGMEKKLLSHIFCSHKFHKIDSLLFLKCWRKKIRVNFHRIIELLKIVTKLKNMGGRVALLRHQKSICQLLRHQAPASRTDQVGVTTMERLDHRLNMKIVLQSLFGLHVTWCEQLYSLAETPQPPSLPPHLRLIYEGAIGHPRWHFLVTPWTWPRSSPS